MGAGTTVKFVLFLGFVCTGWQVIAADVSGRPDSLPSDRLTMPSPPARQENEASGAALAAEVSGVPAARLWLGGAGARQFEWGSGLVSIEGAHLHSYFRTSSKGLMLQRGRVSTLVAGFHVRQDLNSRSSVLFAVAARRQHGGSSVEPISRHLTRSSGVGVEAGMVHDDTLRLLAGYAISSGPGIGGLERSVALSRGAGSENKGFRLSVDFSPNGFSDELSPTFGFELRHFSLSAFDSVALGSARAAAKSAALTFRTPF